MKRLFIAAIYIIISLYTNLYSQSADDTPDPRFADWTEDQFRARDDSIINALYPPLVIVRRENTDIDSIAGGLNPSISSKPSGASPIPVSVSVDTQKSVGQIPITSGFSPTGARTYSVQLELYPGMRDHTPQISLAYNSQQGNGALGDGWYISGLSSITAVNKNLYYDEMVDGISGTMLDAYVLDGMRLIETGGEGDIVKDYSIKYETESNHIKVVAHASYGRINHFDVYYPDGSRATFGKSANNGISYPITSARNLTGDEIKYEYTKSDNIFNVSKISYNNDAATLEFSYDSCRPDTIIRFTGGIMHVNRKRLTGIRHNFKNTNLWEYTLSYGVNRYSSLLKQIDFKSGNQSLNPLKFYYGTGATGNYFNTSDVRMTDTYKMDSLYKTVSIVRGRFGTDPDSDGLIMIPKRNPYYKYYRHSTWLRHSIDRFDSQYTGDEEIFIYSDLSGSQADQNKTTVLTDAGFVDMICADITGDRTESIIKINNYVENNSDKVIFTVYSDSGVKRYSRTFYFSTLHTDESGNKSIQPKFYHSGDFNGDGKMEILAISCHEPFGNTARPSKCYIFDIENGKILYEGHVCPYRVEFVGTQQDDPYEAENNSDKFFIIDYNGDGKSDLCHIDEKGINLYTFNVLNSEITLSKLNTYSGLKKSDLVDRYVYPCDINGDAMTDIVVSPLNNINYHNRWSVYRSNGLDFDKNEFWAMAANRDRCDGNLIQDINGDGMTDLLYYTKGHFYCYLSNGSDFILRSDGPKDSVPTIFIPVNMNAHSTSNQLIELRNGSATKYSFNCNETEESLLTGMVNSNGIIEQNWYNFISDKDAKIYSSSNLYGKFPYITINEPLAVLSHSEIFIDIEGKVIDKNKYSYRNAIVHRQGLGFCGFEDIRITGMDGKTVTRTFDPTCYGILKSEQSPDYTRRYSYSFTRNDNKTVEILLNSVVSVDRIKNLSDTTTYSGYAYGNPTHIKAATSDGFVRNTSLTLINNNELPGYRLGMLFDKNETITRNGVSLTTALLSDPQSTLPKHEERIINGATEYSIDRTYDDNWNLISETKYKCSSNDGFTTTYDYDSYGRLIGTSDYMGRRSYRSYNESGLLSSETDFRNNITSYTYDAFGRESKVTRHDQTEISTTYSWAKGDYGEQYSVTRSETGRPVETVYYDAFNREVRRSQTGISDIVNTVRVYDNYGRLQKISDPFYGDTPKKWTEYTYDDNDRPLSITQPSGRVTEYSYNGNSVTTTEDGVTITRKYDSQGNIVSVTDLTGTIIYDLRPDGQYRQIETTSGETITFGYDELGRQTEIIDPASGTTSYTYDDHGNLYKVINGNDQEIRYKYDSFDLLATKQHDEFSTTYTYNEYGDITDVSSDNGTYTTTLYDEYGRIKSVTEGYKPDNAWLTKEYTYKDNNIRNIRYTSASGLDVTESRSYQKGILVDAKIDSGESIYSLREEDEYGNPLLVYTGDMRREYSYINGFPSTRSASIGDVRYQKESYVFDYRTGNLSRKDDFNDTYTYKYDYMNRLVNDSYNDISVDYDYAGNILSRSDIGTFEYNDPHHFNRLTEVAYCDACVADSADRAITYTSFQRPASISIGNNPLQKSTTTFVYNADFDRVSMTSKTGLVMQQTTRSTIYLGQCYEYDTYSRYLNKNKISYSVEKLYLLGDYYESPVIYVRPNAASDTTFLYYTIRDYMGSVAKMVREDGKDVIDYFYDAWGHRINPTKLYSTDLIRPNDPIAHPIIDIRNFFSRGYCGHEHIMGGLINMNARLYDPDLGRFLSPDPYVQWPDMSQNFNRYAYALNNPFRYTDPNGEFIFTLFTALSDVFYNLWNLVSGNDIDWTRTKNAWKIDAGMFQGNIFQIFHKWTFGILNSVIGYSIAHRLNFIGSVDDVTELDGMLAVSGVTKGSAAFTIGHYSMGPKDYTATWNDHLFVHEYGHYIQSQQWGPLYPFVIGIPSLVTAAVSSDHKNQPHERNASRLGAEHFDKKYGSGADGYVPDSAEYFNIIAFKTGDNTKYENPRYRLSYKYPNGVIRYSQGSAFPF